MPVTITVYGATWCTDCRRVKKYLGEQRIHYTWRDIEAETPEGKTAYKFVLAANQQAFDAPKKKIPVVEITENGDTTILVEPSNAELAKQLGLATQVDHTYHDVVIIGGGPAGLTAAIYLARDGYDVLVIERSTIGGQAYITNQLDNYPGFPEGITGETFATNLRQQAERFGVELLVPHEATKITTCHGHEDFDQCTSKIVYTDTGQEFTCAAILIASGSTYRELNVPGIDNLVGTSVHYCATCDAPFYRDKHLFAVGGGNSAFEESLYLKKFANHVTILVRGAEPKTSPILQEKVDATPGIEVWRNCQITELQGTQQLEKAFVEHKDQNAIKEYCPDGVFVFIGLSPNTNFVPTRIQRDPQQFIITTENLQTSITGIFAAGDCRKGATNQVVAAAGEGAAAAIHIREFLQNR